jgi:predicted cupin superfamily sugar epimerase
MTEHDFTADEIIRRLDLAPHPEGGFYRETFRDARCDANGRSVSSAIYFLLPGGRPSRWHRIDAAEVWHFYAGAALELALRDPDGTNARTSLLGADLALGQEPQAIAPAGHWQSARSLGAWTLVACTVAPAFEFAHFEISDTLPTG